MPSGIERTGFPVSIQEFSGKATLDTGRRMARGEATEAVRHIAAQTNGRLSAEEKIAVSPHILRHTFLRKLAETKGVHYAREASGDQSDRYIWRYVKPNQQTLAETVDELE